MEKEPTTLEEALVEIRYLRSENAALRVENMELKSRLSKVEELLGLNSQNSSKPPSSDLKKSAKKLSSLGRSRGGQKGHPGHFRESWPEELLTEKRECPPVLECPCGGAIAIQTGRVRHQVFELPEIQPEVREYQILTGVCCTCGQTHRGQLPAGVPSGIVGPRLMAWMGMLASYFHLSKAKIQLLIQELLNIRLSTGTISAQEETLSEALTPIYHEAHAAIKQSGFLHVDETGFRQGNTDGQNPKNKKAWIWTAVSAQVTLFLIQLGRGQTESQHLIGKDFTGYVGSDRCPAYAWIPIHRRSFCWAHLLREFRRIAERKDEMQYLAEGLIDSTHKVFELHQAWQRNELTQEQYQRQLQPWRTDVDRFLERGAGFAKHAKPLMAQAGRLFRQLLKDSEALWTHTQSKDLEPSNNRAERALRPIVVWRKVCYGTQSQRGSVFLQHIFTVMASCQQQQRSTLHFLTQAIQAHLNLGDRPSLIPLTELP